MMMTTMMMTTNSAVFAGIIGDSSTTTPFLFLSVTSLSLHANKSPAARLVITAE